MVSNISEIKTVYK